MLRKRILLPLVITFFISCGLITHLVSTHTKKPRRLSQTVNPAPSYEPSIIPDLSNPEVREEIQRKIMEEKAYTHDFIRLPLDYFEKNLRKKKGKQGKKMEKII